MRKVAGPADGGQQDGPAVTADTAPRYAVRPPPLGESIGRIGESIAALVDAALHEDEGYRPSWWSSRAAAAELMPSLVDLRSAYDVGRLAGELGDPSPPIHPYRCAAYMDGWRAGARARAARATAPELGTGGPFR